LTPHGLSLDAAISLAHGIHTLGGAVWSTLPLTDLGTPTLVLRDGEREYVAQFRHHLGESHAHIVFIAPDLAQCADDRGWLALIDAMTAAAGRRGALSLNAQIAETSDSFPLLRRCGFAVYARQDIWRRLPAPFTETPEANRFPLREALESDQAALNSLYDSVVPNQIWQADSLPKAERGLIYEQNGHIMAYFALHEGRSGIFAQVVMQPNLWDQASALCHSWFAALSRVDKVPVYMCVRRYQTWLERPLTLLGFENWDSQALLVKHTAARIERPVRKAVLVLDNAVRAGAGVPHLPPRGKIVKVVKIVALDTSNAHFKVPFRRSLH
jgi:hypothetical protein